MSNSIICKNQLRLGKEARDKYVDQINKWNTKRNELYNRKTLLLEQIKTEDDRLLNTWPTGTYETRGGCDYGWGDSDCNRRCSDDFKGLVSPWSNKRSKYNYLPTSGSWFGPCCCGKNECQCLYVKSWDASTLTTLMASLTDVEADIKNHENNEYPKPAPVQVQCCSNEMSCSGGICYGNLQICESIVENIASTENEPQTFQSIKDVEKKIIQMISNINNNKPIIDIYYNNIQDVDYTKNYKIVYNQISNIYENLKNIYNQIYEDVQSILKFISDIKISNARITVTSQYKSESNRILNDLVENKSPKLIKEFRDILTKYVEIKDIYTSINTENNNFDLMVKNKKKIDELFDFFNKNIDLIIEDYNNLENFTILFDDDLNKISGILNSINNINNIIKGFVTNTKEKLKETEILYDTFDTNSIYKNVINENLNNTTTIVTQIQQKYDKINELIKNSNTIYLTKKDIYEKNRKLKYDEKLLNILEEQEIEEQEKIELKLSLEKLIEEEKIEIELALQKLIEEENNIKNNNNIRNNNNSYVDSNNNNSNVDSNVNRNSNINANITNNNGIGRIYISLIIGGIAIILIIIIFRLPLTPTPTPTLIPS